MLTSAIAFCHARFGIVVVAAILQWTSLRAQTWPYCIWDDPFLLNCADQYQPGINTTWCTGTAPLVDPPEYEYSQVFRPATFCDNTNYVLVFSDEFEGTSLDYSKWSSRNDGFSPNFSVDQHQNVQVSNGELQLAATNVPGDYGYLDFNQNPPEQTGWFEYTTSNVGSVHRFHEGLYEIRCYFRSADDYACDGTFPAFWLYGENNSNGCKGTEIDVFEYRGNDGNRWRMTHHTGTHCSDHRECATCYEGGNQREYLTYRMYWERHSLTWWRSDVGIKRILPKWKVLATGQDIGCNSNEGYYFMLDDFPEARPNASHALNIILNLAIDSRSDVEHEASGFPAELVVDYVRYYRRVPCSGDIQLTSAESVISTFGEYNFLTGTAVSMSNSFSLSASQQLEIVATDHLDIDPGTVFETGSDFIGRIGPSNCGPVSGLALEGGQSEAIAVDRIGELELTTVDPPPGFSVSDMSFGIMTTYLAEHESVAVPIKCVSEAVTVELYNCLGQLSQEEKLIVSNGVLNVPVSNLRSGPYLLRWDALHEKGAVKLVVP